MARTVAIGHQDFKQVIENNYFYIDKTDFIREWWENGDAVTLITRPRRFGKTLNMSMLDYFFSVKHEKEGGLFERFSIWQEEKYRVLQGTYPVISLSFANVKETNYAEARKKICQLLSNLYVDNAFLLESNVLEERDREFFRQISLNMDNTHATLAIYHLSKYLSLYYGKKVIILLDEYDTPMQEAYVDGYWDEMTAFIRSMFHSVFKTNPYLERAIMTGITRISKESIFSDLNNLKVVTSISDEYGTAFGFTEAEVFAALEEYGYDEEYGKKIKNWYDGFTFGKWKDIYNPWSIINFLDTGEFRPYWANTSSNSLAGKLIREGEPAVKITMEDLLHGGVLHTIIDEQIVFNQMNHRTSAIWSLLLASGYLRLESFEINDGKTECDLKLTNREVRVVFEQMIEDWFSEYTYAYGVFLDALLLGDLDAMNEYMNRVANETFSFFDTGKRASGQLEPERFYHGFVLGLMVDLADRYTITSNRESGFGRYDIMLEPKKPGLDAFIIEFKVYNPRKDKSLEDTVRSALAQIEEKQYGTELVKKGIPEEKIRKYGFAFEGKNVLIG